MNKRRAFLNGAGAAAAALAGIYAVGAVLRTIPYPPERVAALAVAAAPGELATAMIERLGHWALRVLALGVHGALLVSAGMAGRWAMSATLPAGRVRRASAIGAVGFVLAVVLAATSPRGLTVAGVVTYLAAALLFARLAGGERLSALLEVSVRDGEAPLDAIGRSRRRFIFRAGAVIGGVLIGGMGVLRLAGRRIRDVVIAHAAKPYRSPPDDPLFPEVAGLSREITLNSDFYTVDINLIKPAVDHTTWSLRIHGLVDEPFNLDYASLQTDFEVIEMAHTLTCISNEVGGDLISTAVWRGVRLGDVLDRADLKEGVLDIVFRASDGYSDSIPLEIAREETTLVVFGMNGEPLPDEHGFPARIIVPGIYGMKNVKWIIEIEAVDHDYQGYWMVRGWSDIAKVKTQSRIDVPADGASVSTGAMLAGVAWAGDRRVLRVEVSEDDGSTWRPAILKRELSPVAWRLWAADAGSGAGRRRVMVRATDGAGAVQSSRPTRPHPDGASGNDAVIFDIEQSTG